MFGLFVLFSDVVAEVNDSVHSLQDRLQDSLMDIIKVRHPGNVRRLGQLFLLLPPITHIKLLAKQFWFDIKKDGRVMMHKLFLEMLEADSWGLLQTMPMLGSFCFLS